MKVSQIILENIGPFFGLNTFDLTTDKNKNIILIGGKNGSGKTTLLKALKFGLFGSFSMGLKTDTKIYFNEIKKILNFNSTDNNYSITVKIELVEQLEKNNYIIKRIWKKDGNELIENLEIFYNDYKVDDLTAYNFLERIKSFTSPKLINCFIYDGEKIGNVIENNQVKEFLKETFETIFNINILNQLSKDINTYIERKVNENVSDRETVAFVLMNEINNIKKQIKTFENDMDSIKQKLQDLTSRKKSIIKEFTMLGGLTKSERKKVEQEIETTAKETEKDNKRFREFVENDIIFMLNIRKLQNAIRQIENEKPLMYLQQIEKIGNYSRIDVSNIISAIETRIATRTTIIHNLNDNYINVIREKINFLRSERRFLNNHIFSKHDIREGYNLLRSKLAIQDMEKFDELLEESRKIDALINKFKSDIKIIQEKKQELEIQLMPKIKNYEYLDDIIKKNNVKENSYIIGTKVLKINDKFYNYLVEKKLQEISTLTLSIFKEVIRKENYISEICIDNDFNISLYVQQKNEFSLDFLSAGETQLLISSLIWAMFKISNRSETFIFDTPLARLDKENRKLFLNNIIKTISDQVIILSTDSEIVNENYDDIMNNVNRHLILEYNEQHNQTTIFEGYFNQVIK